MGFEGRGRRAGSGAGQNAQQQEGVGPQQGAGPGAGQKAQQQEGAGPQQMVEHLFFRAPPPLGLLKGRTAMS